MIVHKNVWGHVWSFESTIRSVEFKQENTRISFSRGLSVEVFDPVSNKYIDPEYPSADVVFYDVAYFKYRVWGYEKLSNGEVIWDDPIIEEKTYRARTPEDQIDGAEGNNLQIRNGNNWCTIEVCARRMEVVVLDTQQE